MPSAPALYDQNATLVRGGRASQPTPYLLKAEDPGLPLELIELIGEAEALALLESDWDGEFSPRIDAGAIRRASWFLENLQVPWLPMVGANRLGGVRVEWDAGHAYLIIDFEPAGEAQVMFRGVGHEVMVWRNEEIPGELGFCYAEVNRARRSG